MWRFQSHTGQLGTAVWASAERRVKGSITGADAQPGKREIEAWEGRVKRHRTETDLEQYRQVSQKTILSAAEALVEHEEK